MVINCNGLWCEILSVEIFNKKVIKTNKYCILLCIYKLAHINNKVISCNFNCHKFELEGLQKAFSVYDVVFDVKKKIDH